MITDDKIKEVRRLIRKGVPEGELKEELTRAGYSKEDIEEVFKPQHYDMRTWYLVFAILVLVFGLWMFLVRQSLLLLILSGLLFWQYFREIQRLKNEKERSERQP